MFYNDLNEQAARSTIPLSREAVPLMEKEGGSIIAMTYYASQRAMPNYNVMGTAKAAFDKDPLDLPIQRERYHGCSSWIGKSTTLWYLLVII